jgi:hypothetical protein
VSEQEYRGSSYATREEPSRVPDERLEGREHEGRSPGAMRDFRGRGPRDSQRSSERIREDVCEWLTDDADVDASDIEVHVEDGIVTLRGSVGDRRQKRRAEDLAEQARGVRDVRNQLEIDRGMLDDLAERVGDRRDRREAPAPSRSEALGEYQDPSWRAVDFRGFDAEARDGTIGTVDERSEVGADHLVVDTGPWIFGRKVVLPAGLVEHVDFDQRRLFVSRSKDEIKNAPEFSEERVEDARYGDELRAYYGGEQAGGRRFR